MRDGEPPALAAHVIQLLELRPVDAAEASSTSSPAACTSSATTATATVETPAAPTTTTTSASAQTKNLRCDILHGRSVRTGIMKNECRTGSCAWTGKLGRFTYGEHPGLGKSRVGGVELDRRQTALSPTKRLRKTLVDHTAVGDRLGTLCMASARFVQQRRKGSNVPVPKKRRPCAPTAW